MLNVLHKQDAERGFVATISFGFDRDTPMAGPFLDPLNPQSELSEALLQAVTVVLADQEYVERLERHYHLVKQAAADRYHPAHLTIRQFVDEEGSAGFRLGPAWERVPRSAPCPCGSGRPYKRCCMRKDRLAHEH
jgi:hypothetical protein